MAQVKKSHFVIPSSTQADEVLAILKSYSITARVGKSIKSTIGTETINATEVIASGDHSVASILTTLSRHQVLSGLSPDDLQKAAGWRNLRITSKDEISTPKAPAPAHPVVNSTTHASRGEGLNGVLPRDVRSMLESTATRP